MKVAKPGETFGRWTVLSGLPDRRRRQCRCACGNERAVLASNLVRGLSRSCGCLLREFAAAQVRHGGRRRGATHPLYSIWRGMRKRCRYRGDKRWSYYGGRGITVCERWLGNDGFANFVADMGPRPEGTTLDRIDNDGNYEPDNCHWATAVEQRRNRPYRRGGEDNGSSPVV